MQKDPQGSPIATYELHRHAWLFLYDLNIVGGNMKLPAYPTLVRLEPEAQLPGGSTTINTIITEPTTQYIKAPIPKVQGSSKARPSLWPFNIRLVSWNQFRFTSKGRF